MAVTIISRPSNFSSAYNPVEYVFSSSIVGISGNISAIQETTSSTFPGKVTLYHSGISRPRTILEGMIATITNTPGGVYDGEHSVLFRDNTVFVILDLEFTEGVSSGEVSFSALNGSIVCDLYMDNSLVVRKSRFPNINDQFVFDFSHEIQPGLGNGMKPLSLGSTSNELNPEASATIHVEYAEVFDIASGTSVTPTFILNENVTPNALFSDSDNPITIINAIVPQVEWLMGSVKNELISTSTDLSPFIVDAAGSNRFLTNSPKNIRIGENDNYQLSFIMDFNAAVAYRKEIVAFAENGAVIKTTRFTLNTPNPTTDGVWDIVVGTREISDTFIPSNTAYYEVSIVDQLDSFSKLTEVMTFNIDRKCYGSQTRFVWLNPRGGYDAYTFNSPRKLNSSVRKSSYSKSRVHPVVVSDRQESITKVTTQDSITTGTDKVDRETAEWLQDLLESPQVFIELAEGNALHSQRIPVTLVNKTMAICDSYNGLFNVRLRYKFAFNKNVLRAY